MWKNQIFILLSIFLSQIDAYYHCRSFRTQWANGTKSLAYESSFIPLDNTSYSVHIYNISSKNLSPNQNKIDVYPDGGAQCNAATDCTPITMAECWFNCTNPNYFGMPVMIFPSAADGGGWDSMLVDGNMSYAADDGSMLTPDYPWVWIESSLGSDPTNITMWCNEFDIADIGSTPSVTCTEITSNIIIRNSTTNDLYFNWSLTLQHKDDCVLYGCVDLQLINYYSKINMEIALNSPNAYEYVWYWFNTSNNFTPDPTDPNTFYLNSYANFIDFQLSINYTLQYFDYWPDDNRNPFLARLIPIEYYSINGLRLNSNFQPISPTNPIVNSRLDTNLKEMTSSINSYCTKFSHYVQPTTLAPFTPPPSSSNCPSGWYYGTVAEKCYYFGFQDVEWGINANLCPGSSTLVSIDSAFENNEIQSLGRALSRCAGGFIGLTTWGVPGVTTWHWGNNDSSPYRNWKQGYPINDNVYPGWATCAVMEWSSGKWMNDDCNIGRCYICQMSKGLFLEKAHKRQKDGQQNERAMNKRFARYHQKMNKD